MAKSTKDSGWITRNTVMEYTYGPMVEAMRATTETIRNTGMGRTLGLTDESTSVNGKTTSGMEGGRM